jgi:serine protease Do/serine protease DegQ
VSTTDLTPDAARELRVNVSDGAVVVQVEKGSAAERAGLRAKDVVVGANGRPVRNSGDFRNRVGLTPVGEEIGLQVLREGRTVQTRARIAEPFAATHIPSESVPQLAGARVANIQPGMPMYGTLEGVMVTSVAADSSAYKNGLRPGDIIYGVGRRRVRSANEFLATLRGADKPLQLLLLRGEYRITLVVR